MKTIVINFDALLEQEKIDITKLEDLKKLTHLEELLVRNETLIFHTSKYDQQLVENTLIKLSFNKVIIFECTKRNSIQHYILDLLTEKDPQEILVLDSDSTALEFARSQKCHSLDLNKENYFQKLHALLTKGQQIALPFNSIQLADPLVTEIKTKIKDCFATLKTLSHQTQEAFIKSIGTLDIEQLKKRRTEIEKENKEFNIKPLNALIKLIENPLSIYPNFDIGMELSLPQKLLSASITQTLTASITLEAFAFMRMLSNSAIDSRETKIKNLEQTLTKNTETIQSLNEQNKKLQEQIRSKMPMFPPSNKSQPIPFWETPVIPKVEQKPASEEKPNPHGALIASLTHAADAINTYTKKPMTEQVRKNLTEISKKFDSIKLKLDRDSTESILSFVSKLITECQSIKISSQNINYPYNQSQPKTLIEMIPELGTAKKKLAEAGFYKALNTKSSNIISPLAISPLDYGYHK